ncbi:hypothetical protein GOQ29_14280 [Clostridium sp. D2Q-14]|uniref:hypothetical protein n=1 Tax=Anaeromonas gelatinilytica TaxID=2683194 RepID=UPI00193C0331|nr:hypothetical protein [Anaeromonas gelatinilytica]MBS4536785.1 hypothetical protein [Anaeromonas gelatinilytica]
MELKLNLRNNSYDYLINSIDTYEKAINYGDHHLTTYYEKLKLKTSFILLLQSYELMLKAILYDKHKNLIYTNIDLQRLDNAHTVSFINAINRINNFTEYTIEEKDKTVLIKCSKLRNDFIHYQVNIHFEQLRQELLNLFVLYNKIHCYFYGHYIKISHWKDIKLEKQINNKFKNILNDTNFTIFRGRDFLKENLQEFKKELESNQNYHHYISVNNKKYKRIKMGSENDFFRELDKVEYISDIYEREYCHDCLAKNGKYHMFEYHCDLEVCPVCGGQILTCGCIKSKAE